MAYQAQAGACAAVATRRQWLIRRLTTLFSRAYLSMAARRPAPISSRSSASHTGDLSSLACRLVNRCTRQLARSWTVNRARSERRPLHPRQAGTVDLGLNRRGWPGFVRLRAMMWSRSVAVSPQYVQSDMGLVIPWAAHVDIGGGRASMTALTGTTGRQKPHASLAPFKTRSRGIPYVVPQVKEGYQGRVLGHLNRIPRPQ